MWVLSFAVLHFFSSGIFNVRYCGIIEPCGTCFFILLGNGIGKRSFTVLRQIARCSFALSSLKRVDIFWSLHLMVNDYTRSYT